MTKIQFEILNLKQKNSLKMVKSNSMKNSKKNLQRKWNDLKKILKEFGNFQFDFQPSFFHFLEIKNLKILALFRSLS